MTINFFKYQGTGNDFILLDNRTHAYDNLTENQVKHLCNRHFGIGADGLMLLNKHVDYDFEMVYYNADGNISSMCGNGGRCIVRFAYDCGLIKEEYRFLAVDGEHRACFDEQGWVKLQMKDVDTIQDYHGDYILNTGSPHLVKLANNIGDKDVFNEGRKTRYNNDFKENGINVNFVEQHNNHIEVRTYERGVENETLSCGTGVTAASLVSAHNESGFNRVEVKTLGGHLAVEFEKNGPKQFSAIWLCGPATFVFKGEVTLKT